MTVFRRVAASAVAATLAWALAAPTAPGTGPATDVRLAASAPRAAAALPLVETDPGPVSFSPNGDGRLDRAPIRFTLNRDARVRVRVRNSDGLVSGPVRLGLLAKGAHTWRWDGRTNGGTVAPDGSYRVRVTAVTPLRTRTAIGYVDLDTVRPQGRLLTTRPTVYPKASVVDDHVQLVWLLDGWNPGDEEFFPEGARPAETRVTIRTPTGDLVWRRTVRDQYTPTFDWYAHRDGDAALPAGRYVARARVSDAAGNRRWDSRDLTVSHAQLAEEVWSTTVAAGLVGRYSPYFGGCNGCPDSWDPVASDRFEDGLSFRPPPEDWYWGTAGYFGTDVPFAEAPVDAYRITATGGPTTEGGSDQGNLAGVLTEPGDGSTTTAWGAVDLTSQPFLPGRGLPVTWTFTTSPEDSYDVATFTVEYKHYAPVS